MLQVCLKIGNIIMDTNAAIGDQSLETDLRHAKNFTGLAQAQFLLLK